MVALDALWWLPQSQMTNAGAPLQQH